MSFSGFSEDDIRKLKSQEVNKPQKGGAKSSVKKVTFKSNSTTNAPRTKSLINNNVVNNNAHSVQTSEIPEEAKLNIPKNDVKNDLVQVNDTTIQAEATKIESVKPQDTQNSVPGEKKPIDLDEFEARQKLIEEQNRKRKELLAKALADRTKQTQEEAQRLGEIREEFKKLDAMLSSDVKILRKQIEAASIEYMECQKKYDKIEKEFLDAKILLHQKLEKKEMLTEHLCTIIEKNEERKADKLTELLNKLQIKPPEVNEVANESGS